VGCSEQSNEPSRSIKSEELLDGVTISFTRKDMLHRVRQINDIRHPKQLFDH